MENNRPSTSGRPVRTTLVPARLQDTGESGAAAGLGQSRSSQGITREALSRCAGRAASVDAPEVSSAPRLPLASLVQASKSVGIDDDSGGPAENTPARFRLQQVGKYFSSGSDIDEKTRREVLTSKMNLVSRLHMRRKIAWHRPPLPAPPRSLLPPNVPPHAFVSAPCRRLRRRRER